MDSLTIVKKWLSGTYSNYGFMVKDSAESGSTRYTQFYSADSWSPHRPELHIVYTGIKTGRVCYNSSLSQGLTTSINNILLNEDYDSSVISDPSIYLMEYYFDNKNITFHHTHGAPGLFVCSDGNITTSTINTYYSGQLSNARLIYISACETGE